MNTGEVKREQVLKGLVEEQWELLYDLMLCINNLVERNPKPTESTPNVVQKPDNVFDEIIDTLHKCRGLTKEATEKVRTGIVNKVC